MLTKLSVFCRTLGKGEEVAGDCERSQLEAGGENPLGVRDTDNLEGRQASGNLEKRRKASWNV